MIALRAPVELIKSFSDHHSRWSKRILPSIWCGVNIALIFSGCTVKYFSNLPRTMDPRVDGWKVCLKGMMGIVVLLGLVITSIYWRVNKLVLNDDSLPKSNHKKKKVSRILECVSLTRAVLEDWYICTYFWHPNFIVQKEILSVILSLMFEKIKLKNVA